MAQVNLTDRDIDALSRMAYAEARSIAKETGNLKASYGSIVDAALNRMAANQPYMGGDTVSGVLNKRYQFSPVNAIRSWTKLAKPPNAVYEAVKSHLADLKIGKPNVIGKATHYLNPTVPGTAHARNTWAKNYASWPSVGVGTQVHAFGSPDAVDVPDYSVSYEPRAIPTPRQTPNATIGQAYAEMGRSKALAPKNPVDRSFTTEGGQRTALAAAMQKAGLIGLDGRAAPGQTFAAAPVEKVERRGLPAPGASSFPARPGVIAPNNTRTATPALDRALEQRGISRPSPATQPATQQAATRDPSTLSPGTYPGRVVGDGISPTFAGQQPALTSPTSLSSFPARPATIAPNTRPHLAAALQKAGLVTPGDPAPTRLAPSLDSQQLSPVAGVPVTTVRTRPVEIRTIPRQPAPTQIAPVKPRQIAPVQPRVIQPVQQPPQPVQPVQAPAPLGQQAFDARANPVDPGLRAADVYGGAIGTAQTSTPGTTVSRQNSWGPTTVTNKFGAQTAMVGDRQAAVGKPFGGLGGNLSPNAKSVLGGLAGGILGAMAAGPTGALAGGMLGRKMASGGLGGSSAPGGGGGQAGGGLLGGMFGGGTVGNARGGNNERSGGTGGGTIGGGGGRGRRGGQGN